MRNKHTQTCKISLVLLLTLFLAACGGGGNSSNNADDQVDLVTNPNDGDPDVCEQIDTNNDPSDDCVTEGVTDTPDTTGTGVCVNFASPKVGDKGLIRNVTTDDDGNSFETDVRTTYTAVSSTSWNYDSEVSVGGLGDIEDLIPDGLLPEGVDLDDSLGQISQTTETFTIANNFINITKSVTTSASLGVITTTYSPPRRAPINEVCEGQVFTQNYTQTQVSLGGTDIENVSVKNTIEAVNVQKSAPAGTFNTFQVKSEDSELTLTTWVDTASSTIVVMESRNADGDLLGTASLIEQ